MTIAVGAVYALRYADVSRVMLGVIAVYGFGVMLANLWNILAAKPINPSYVAAFGIMFLVSATTHSGALEHRSKAGDHLRMAGERQVDNPSNTLASIRCSLLGAAAGNRRSQKASSM